MSFHLSDLLPFKKLTESFYSKVLDQNGNMVGVRRAFTMDMQADPLTTTPNDPQFNNQWHLKAANGINVQNVWDDYKGSGILIGFSDSGVQYTHPDITANYNTSLDWDIQSQTPDARPRDPLGVKPEDGDNHGTTTVGLLVASGNNKLGITGVAYQAKATTIRMDFGANWTDAQFAEVYARQQSAHVDISNNSWGFGGFFQDPFSGGSDPLVQMGAAIQDLAVNGRNGLGTNVVFSAGNSRDIGDNTNYHGAQNSLYTITVGATGQDGKSATVTQSGTVISFSTQGASLLTSAPGDHITTTDRTGKEGYVKGDYDIGGSAGTSYSAPIVSGVIALMLQANPNLGYRDVQEILAYSSRKNDPTSSGWHDDGAGNWNGGGLHFNHDYGFGLVDAHGAVRLAETWQSVSTYANRAMVDANEVTANSAIPDNNAAGVSSNVSVDSHIDIDRVEIDVNITHSWIGDLVVTLTSPNGTVSTLVDRPGVTGGIFGDPAGADQDDIHATLSSNAFWGENGDGNWTLKVSDGRGGNVGMLDSWHLRLYGDVESNNDLFVYTDEYGESLAANAARGTLSDSGGTDTINLAALSTNAVLSLVPGSISNVDGASLTIAPGTVIENAFLGDGNDTVIGNDAANMINGARGNDVVLGGAGNDSLDGGVGADTALFNGSVYDFIINIVNSFTLSVQDTVAGNGDEGVDTLLRFEKLQFADGLLMFNGTSLISAPGVNLGGTKNNDSIDGSFNNDTIDGGRGNDLINGLGGSDVLRGNYDNDTIYGGGGNDSIYGDKGNNVLNGGAGQDLLVSDSGALDVFVYQGIGDAGDTVQGFRRGEDVLDLRLLMDSIGYLGNNPIADGRMSLVVAPGNDLQVWIDADGVGGNPAVMLLNLDNLKATALTLGVDYLV